MKVYKLAHTEFFKSDIYFWFANQIKVNWTDVHFSLETGGLVLKVKIYREWKGQKW